jgi:hypothetical protein
VGVPATDSVLVERAPTPTLPRDRRGRREFTAVAERSKLQSTQFNPSRLPKTI